ncbi:hypothetical protein [Candidatus Uabimicrobium amorphum]|uniref:Uncharacterized protein n=1 Tax=Uabimicrobium amorphum TaxID=2596890 RepID=A0A5S9IUP7_UABAM|nr:hypothetical protein [Candidatus Uabimicrobium amorphum]BBM86935.1 hypothetical protein UABAM_05337 [Candidatus Uabimicrobium amorphum]
MRKNQFFSAKNDQKQEKSRVNVISNIITNATGKNTQQTMGEEIQNLRVRIQTLEEEMRELKSLLQKDDGLSEPSLQKEERLPKTVKGWSIKSTASAIHATKKIKNKHHRVYICKNAKLFSKKRAQEKIENYIKKHKISL